MLNFIGGFVIGLVIVLALFMYIVFDMFGAPHPRPKFFFEFWRDR